MMQLTSKIMKKCRITTEYVKVTEHIVRLYSLRFNKKIIESINNKFVNSIDILHLTNLHYKCLSVAYKIIYLPQNTSNKTNLSISLYQIFIYFSAHSNLLLLQH